MFKFVKKYLFDRDMKEVRKNMAAAWKNIKRADDYYSEGNKDVAINCFHYACECLLKSHKFFCQATNYIPKYDHGPKMEIVELIMELDDPKMYDYIFPGFRPVYNFKNKAIQKKWEEQRQFFVDNSKDLIPYEKILKEYPYSSILKDYNK